MSHDGKGVSKAEAIRRGEGELPVQLEDPAAARRAEQQNAGKPAQVSPQKARKAEDNPEDVPMAGDMGPPEGPGS